jgi:DNA-binding MarR family transcriptional regulator
MTAERFVATDAVRAAIKGRESDLLDALGVRWREGRPHITCPYPQHRDSHPSWRWVERKARAYCTCIAGSHSILDVTREVTGLDFQQTKIRVAELLNRPELIHQGRREEGGRGIISPSQPRNRATPRENPGNSDDSSGKSVAEGNSTPRNGATLGCTLAGYAAAKRLPPEFLLSLGIREFSYLRSPALRIPYFGFDGGEPAIRFRVALTGDDRFRWKRGDKPRLYGLNRLAQARSAGYIALVEGESDCHTLWFHREPALGLPGASNWNENRDAPLLDGIDVIYLMVEPDQGGKTAVGWLAKSCIRNRVRLISLDGFKDPSALFLDNPEHFATRWRAVLDGAESYQTIAEREDANRARQAKEAAGDLILEPDILARFVADLVKAGLVGEERNAKVLFLALTTRLFDRPVSIAVKGPSSGGKSFTVETVLRFFPPSAFVARTMMSDRALAYSDEDFRHRHLIIFEVAGMSSEVANYLVRSLLSEGLIKYEMVEKTKDGLKPRLIEKEGPTGLIVTTTATQLHPENETRLMSLAVKDTPEQTAVILRALARDRETDGEVDHTSWQAFQRWLAAGECRVTAPFALDLAKRIPPVAVRLRRDFALLLGLIQAHALVHREHRMRDDQGRIVATLDDYGAVRDLVADLFAEGVDATVKAATRETVAAVDELVSAGGKDEVSVAEIAKHLKLDKGAASRRVADAVSSGYLVNNEDRRGRKARIALGDLLPGAMEILPQPEALHR